MKDFLDTNRPGNVPPALKKWIADIVRWFKDHPEREYRIIWLPANLARDFSRLGLITLALDGTGKAGTVVMVAENLPLCIIARRADGLANKYVPDFLVLGAFADRPPAAPPGMDKARMEEMMCAAIWAMCEAGNKKGLSLRDVMQDSLRSAGRYPPRTKS